MWPDQVLNPGPLTYESGALPTALRGPARLLENGLHGHVFFLSFSRGKQLLCLHFFHWLKNPSKMGSTSEGKNFIQKEQVLALEEANSLC